MGNAMTERALDIVVVCVNGSEALCHLEDFPQFLKDMQGIPLSVMYLPMSQQQIDCWGYEP